METTTCPSRVEIGEDIIFQPLQEEVVLLNMTSQQYFGLNDVGTTMWRLLTDFHDIETVVDRVCAEYSVDKITARRDVKALVGELLDAGLIKVADIQKQGL